MKSHSSASALQEANFPPMGLQPPVYFLHRNNKAATPSHKP
jgi:hypothetical protein